MFLETNFKNKQADLNHAKNCNLFSNVTHHFKWVVSYNGSQTQVFSKIAALKRIFCKTFVLELTLRTQNSTSDILIVFNFFGVAFSQNSHEQWLFFLETFGLKKLQLLGKQGINQKAVSNRRMIILKQNKSQANWQ